MFDSTGFKATSESPDNKFYATNDINQFTPDNTYYNSNVEDNDSPNI